MPFDLIPFDEPGARLFWGHLLVAGVLALGYSGKVTGLQPKSLLQAIRSLFLNRKFWWNSSTKFDYLVVASNAVFRAFLIMPFLNFSFEIASFVSRGILSLQPEGFVPMPVTSIALVVASVASFIWDDWLRYLLHKLMHQIPLLWKLHRWHHSATVLTPVTLYRIHPFESALAMLRYSLSWGVATGVFVGIFAAPLSVWTLLGVNVFGFLFNLLGANLRHSHVPMSFPNWLEKLLISPVQHQLHHAKDPQFYDCNFGVSLAIWDRMNGSLRLSTERPQNLRFGVGRKDRPRLQRWLQSRGSR